jgi:hypothetical protein
MVYLFIDTVLELFDLGESSRRGPDRLVWIYGFSWVMLMDNTIEDIYRENKTITVTAEIPESIYKANLELFDLGVIAGTHNLSVEQWNGVMITCGIKYETEKHDLGKLFWEKFGFDLKEALQK